MLGRFYNKYFFYINKFQIFKYKMLGASIGPNVKSYGRFTVMTPKNLSVGENSTINEGVHFNCRDNVKIGNGVRISTNVQLHTGRLILDSLPRIHSKSPIIIKDNVWIASSVVVLAGVTIHENSVIAAGSVVTKDVPPDCLVGGVPAKVLKRLYKSVSGRTSKS